MPAPNGPQKEDNHGLLYTEVTMNIDQLMEDMEKVEKTSFIFGTM